MKFATYELNTPLGTLARLGCIVGTRLIDVNLAVRVYLDETQQANRAEAIADSIAPSDLLSYLDTGKIAHESLTNAIQYVMRRDQPGDPPGLALDIEAAKLLAPLQVPRSLREFGQFIGHANHGGGRQLPDVWYEAPHYWKGNPQTIIGPHDQIEWPHGVERLDFELEIACVIGRSGRDIQENEALQHVAGFTLFNDVCARDLQAREIPAMKGPSKSHDFCSVLGPILVSADEIDLSKIEAKIVVNGEQWATGTTQDMHFGWPTLIAHASKYEGLVPGDVLVSGTLTGCSAIEHFGWNSEGPLLRPGDDLQFVVDGLGTLHNRVGPKPRTS